MKIAINVMTWISVILLGALTVTSAVRTEPNRLAGRWIWTEGTFDDCGESFSQCGYSFQENGRYTYRNDYLPYQESGNYRLEGNLLTLSRDDGGQEQYLVTINGDVLVWEDEEDCQLFARDSGSRMLAAAGQ